MGFSGVLVLGHSVEQPVTSVGPLAGLGKDQALLVGRRADGWQLVEVLGHTGHASVWVPALVAVTAAPVLCAEVHDSDSAVVLADSPAGHWWSAWLPRRSAFDAGDVPATGELLQQQRLELGLASGTETAPQAAAWATDAGQRVDVDHIAAALDAADTDSTTLDNTDQTFFSQENPDTRAYAEALLSRPPFVEIYVSRLLDSLGINPPPIDPASAWAHMASWQPRTIRRDHPNP